MIGLQSNIDAKTSREKLSLYVTKDTENKFRKKYYILNSF